MQSIIIRLKARLRYLDVRRGVKKRWILREAPLADCVSYHGFHYDRASEHPLQKYAIGLQEGTDIRLLRAQFIDFLRYYRPINIAQAMGLPDLDPRLPSWLYPWKRALHSDFTSRRGWFDEPHQCSDILTRFCDSGIPSFRIEEEWMWQERALSSLRSCGYLPTTFGFIRAHSFEATDGRIAYLLLDGNHRAAALCAMGVSQVKLKIEARWQIRECEVERWPGVRNGRYSRESALQIFHGFIDGNCQPRTTQIAAPIIAPPHWLELYSVNNANKGQKSYAPLHIVRDSPVAQKSRAMGNG